MSYTASMVIAMYPRWRRCSDADERPTWRCTRKEDGRRLPLFTKEIKNQSIER